MRKEKRKFSWKKSLLFLALLAGLSMAGCAGGKEENIASENASAEENGSLPEAEEIQAAAGEEDGSGEAEASEEPEEREPRPAPQVTAPLGEGEGSYLGGATLMLLASEDGGQNLSSVIQTKNGSVIVVDGGRPCDDAHLVETIQSMGGKVDVWLITHPHDDHIGALNNILNMDPMPIEIGDIYFNFLNLENYNQGENMGRVGFVEDVLTSFEKVDPERLHTPLEAGTEISVDDVKITVLNEPFFCLDNIINNSSVAYRLDINGKRILYLGDMGWQAGDNFLEVCSAEDMKADVVQMAHHGQTGVEMNVYEVVAPEICLWPTPQWLWDNEKDGVAGAGDFRTLEVRGWMDSLGVQYNICVKDGDQILR